MTKPPSSTSEQPAAAGLVMVFIDGWNLHRACERAFGDGQIHPLLLGRELAGERPLGGVHYFMGMPDPRIEEDGGRQRQRQIEFMQKTGVVTVTKKLKYRWEWKLDKWSLPHPRDFDGETREATATARLQGREKGVDVSLAIAAFRAAQKENVGTIVIVSADSDLDIVPTSIAADGGEHRERVENAVVNPHGKKIINRTYDWSHQIDRAMFNRIRDDLNYNKPIKPAARDAVLKRLKLTND